MQELVTPQEALNIVLDCVAVLGTEVVPHGQALGRTLGADIVSDLDLPPFDNSAVDGYAVHSRDVASASADSPVQLPVVGTIAAGAATLLTVEPGACCKIMTGAPMPRGADAVVMREDAQALPDAVRILRASAAGSFVRRAGSDVARGTLTLSRGTPIGAAQWGLLASLNQNSIAVYRRPRIGLITTGSELVDPGAELALGQIRDSNRYTMAGLSLSCGARVCHQRRTGDDLDEFEAALRQCAADCDVVVAAGGVSVGDFDPVRDVLQRVARVHFWKIAMKPGKPVMFATIDTPDGRTIPVFGLPGNPVSVMVSFEQLARPALLKMQGRRALRRPVLQVKLASGFGSAPGITEFVRARVEPNGAGWRAYVERDQGSGRLSTMTGANALLLVPPEVGGVEAGDSLPAQMIDWPELD